MWDLDDTIVFERAHGEWEDDRIRQHPAGPAGMKRLRVEMLAFFQQLKQLGEVFFVTARESSEEARKWTVAELRRKGIRGWECLFLCPPDMRRSWETIAAFKRNARRKIERETKRIILMTAGDKWSDHLAHRLTKEQDTLDAGQDKYVIARISERNQRSIIALKLPSRAALTRRQHAAPALTST